MKNFYLIFSVLLSIGCSKTEPLNPRGDLLPTKTVTTLKDGTFFGSKTFIYDDNRLVEISFSNVETDNAGSAELIYSNDLLIKIIQYDQNANPKEYLDLKYDSNNRLEQYVVYRLDQEKAYKVVLEYTSGNTIEITTYAGDFDSQTELAGVMTYTLDLQNNITKIQTATYQIVYEYDSRNGIYKNLVARDVLNILGRLGGALNRGGMNNAISYEFSNNTVTDHVDLNYTYNDNSYPISRVEMIPNLGEGLHTEFIYE